MRLRVRRWGNSLALRIPKPFAAEAKVGEGTFVDLSVTNGKLVIAPLTTRYTLRQLLRGVSPENLHEESDFGPATGREA